MNKHTLRQYRAILREIGHLEAEKEAMLGSLGQPKSDGQPNGKGRIGDPVLQAVAKRAKLQKLIDDRLDRLIALREEIETAIADLPATERDLMRLRYIDGMTWERSPWS